MAEPFLNNNFVVNFLGKGEIGFSEITEIEQYMEVVDYREGGNQNIYKIPGLLKTGKVVFKKGVADNLIIFEAFEEAKSGIKGNISIKINSGENVKTIELINAWPCRYSISKLDALTSEVLIESVEVVFEEMTIN